MAVKSLPRPELSAYDESLRLSFSELVRRLTELIGRKLTAYVGGVKDVRALDRWINGGQPYGEAEARLRLLFQIVQTLVNHDSPTIVQAWLTGVNPVLGDRVPLRLLRDGDIDVVGREVMAAARAFIAGG